MALRLGIVGALGRDIGRFRVLFLDGADEFLCRERLSARLVVLFLLDIGFDDVAQIGKTRVGLLLPLALCGLLDLFPPRGGCAKTTNPLQTLFLRQTSRAFYRMT